ncbi:hypothetical protein [uncultured Campylobacter sp.]|nr:hypothetical protein [uncultured Campylobacter sp.]
MGSVLRQSGGAIGGDGLSCGRLVAVDGYRAAEASPDDGTYGT